MTAVSIYLVIVHLDLTLYASARLHTYLWIGKNEGEISAAAFNNFMYHGNICAQYFPLGALFPISRGDAANQSFITLASLGFVLPLRCLLGC